ncbi:MAG: FecR domain-containing protein [Bacteroidetes bacterium]|nr:FecR domain-containing protein [Bacteroidota bacterium]
MERILSRNKELFNSARFVWERSLEAENVPYKTEDALGKVHARLGMNNNKQLKNKTLTIYSKIAAIAAVIMLPLLFFYLLSKNNQQTEIAYKTVNTENEIRNIKLEDGSEVWLNQNSTLSVPELKGNSYVLKLKGEAYFQVAKTVPGFLLLKLRFRL